MRIGLFLLMLFLFVARGAMAETIVLRGAAQGTTYHIKLVAGRAAVDIRALERDVAKCLGEVDRQMSTYRDDSEISRFNRAPAGEWFAVSPAVVEVVKAAREISEKTGGAMDVTVGPLVRVWHFGKGARSERRGASKEGSSAKEFVPPSEEKFAAVREHVGYAKLASRAGPPALRKAGDGVEVDLSAIASGYTIDALADLLKQHGTKDFMVELGGEIRAAGKREDGKPWRVAIDRPMAETRTREIFVSVPLVDMAIATAGGTHKFYEFGGRRYSHIIDPATGRPVEHTLDSVTVAADTCMEADGWDTPLLVMGPERGVECAERNGIAALFISGGESGGSAADSARATSAWRKRFGGDESRGDTGTGGASGTR